MKRGKRWNGCAKVWPPPFDLEQHDLGAAAIVPDLQLGARVIVRVDVGILDHARRAVMSRELREVSDRGVGREHGAAAAPEAVERHLAALVGIHRVLGAVQDQDRDRLPRFLAVEVRVVGQRRRHRRHRRDPVRQLEREAIGELAAVRDPRGVDAIGIRVLLGDEEVDHLSEERDVVDVLRVGRVGRRGAAIVPVLLEAVRVDGEEAVAVGEPIELVVGRRGAPRGRRPATRAARTRAAATPRAWRGGTSGSGARAPPTESEPVEQLAVERGHRLDRRRVEPVPPGRGDTRARAGRARPRRSRGSAASEHRHDAAAGAPLVEIGERRGNLAHPDHARRGGAVAAGRE